MLTEATLLSYLNDDEGWKVGKSRSDFTVSVKPPGSLQWQKLVLPTQAATNDERGVYLRWFACDGKTYDLSQREYNVGGKCPDEDHVHIEIRVRTKAGGMTTNSRTLRIPDDLSSVQNARGAPKNRKKITKLNLPEAYNFAQESLRQTHGGWERVTMLSWCRLVGPVGISDNAKVQADVAMQPGEEVWFHFDCTSPSTATFDIITDGDVFYPLNRRSHRITTNLKPKSSIDLTQLSILDQEIFIRAIEQFAKEITNG